MSSIQNHYGNPVQNNTVDDGMWVDEDLQDFVDCFSLDLLTNSTNGVALHGLDPFEDDDAIMNWEEETDSRSNQRDRRRNSLLGYDRRHSLLGGFERRHSLLSGCDPNFQQEALPKKPTSSHDPQRNQHFQQPSHQHQQEHLPPTAPQVFSQKSQGLEMDSSEEEFERKFKQGLSNLEKSMKRTEESRILLSQQRPSLGMMMSLLEGASSTTKEGQHQLLSYVSQLRNNSTIM